MAAQKKPARSGSGRATSGGAQQPPGGNRSAAASARQRTPGTTGRASGNGAGSAKSRPTTNGASAARSASASGSARTASATQAASPPAASLVSRIVGPFRTVGPVPLATFIFALYALGASIYLTITHYDTSVTLACSDKGIVNCAEVTTSAQSMVFGVIPVAVIGLAYYVFMVALNSPWVWRLQQTGSDQVSKILRYTRLGAIVAGMGFVLYLIFAELIQIGAICLWCTSVHVATFLIFVLIVFYTSLSPSRQAKPGRG